MELLNTFRYNIIYYFSKIIGTDIYIGEIVLIIILLYIVWLFFLIEIHSKLLKRENIIKQECSSQYDNIRYLLAKSQHDKLSVINQNDIQWIKIILNAKNKDYISHHDEIKNEIEKLEGLINQKIIDENQRNKINKLRKKIKNLKNSENILWRAISILTIFIYKIFR